MVKFNQCMWAIKVAVMVFMVFIFSPKMVMALDDVEAEKLKAEITKLEKEDPTLAAEVKDQLKEAVIKGEVQIEDKQNQGDADLNDHAGINPEQALQEITKNEQKLLDQGLTPEDVAKLKELAASGSTDHQAFEAIFEKVKGGQQEGGTNPEFVKEMIGFDPKELGRPMMEGREGAPTKEMMEHMAKEMGKDMTPEQAERMAKEMGRGDMTPEKMERMAKEMGHEITPQEREQMERFVAERGGDHERGDFERMARDFEKLGFDRDKMEKEMRDHERGDFDREKFTRDGGVDRERFEREGGFVDRERFEREVREHPEFDREKFVPPPGRELPRDGVPPGGGGPPPGP